MNRILSYFTTRFGQKDITQYPELLQKKQLPYYLPIYPSLMLDESMQKRSVNWRVI